MRSLVCVVAALALARSVAAADGIFLNAKGQAQLARIEALVRSAKIERAGARVFIRGRLIDAHARPGACAGWPTAHTSGPALPNVTLPLRSIGEHAAKHTDAQLARLVKVIDDAGYLHATLFVLVADHGLHAYRKDDRVIRADGPRGLNALFDDMGLKLWTGGMPGPLGMFADVDNYDLVYAPNGGLAHLYIRNGTVTKRTGRQRHGRGQGEVAGRPAAAGRREGRAPAVHRGDG